MTSRPHLYIIGRVESTFTYFRARPVFCSLSFISHSSIRKSKRPNRKKCLSREKIETFKQEISSCFSLFSVSRRNFHSDDRKNPPFAVSFNGKSSRGVAFLPNFRSHSDCETNFLPFYFSSAV